MQDITNEIKEFSKQLTGVVLHFKWVKCDVCDKKLTCSVGS